MGVLFPEKCLEARLAEAKKRGADVHMEERMISFTPQEDGTLVNTDKGAYLADKVILCVGPWIKDTLGEAVEIEFSVHRSVMYWMKVDDQCRSLYSANNFPVTMWDSGDGNMTIVFPRIKDEETVKVMHFPKEQLNLLKVKYEDQDRNVTEEEQIQMYEKFIRPYFTGITGECQRKHTCFYTLSPTRRFVIDYPFQSNQAILVVSACARQGFKYSAAIGEAVAERMLFNKNEKTFDIIERFGQVFAQAQIKEKPTVTNALAS